MLGNGYEYERSGGVSRGARRSQSRTARAGGGVAGRAGTNGDRDDALFDGEYQGMQGEELHVELLPPSRGVDYSAEVIGVVGCIDKGAMGGGDLNSVGAQPMQGVLQGQRRARRIICWGRGTCRSETSRCGAHGHRRCVRWHRTVSGHGCKDLLQIWVEEQVQLLVDA